MNLSLVDVRLLDGMGKVYFSLKTSQRAGKKQKTLDTACAGCGLVFRAFHIHRQDARPVSDEAAAANDDTPHGQAGLRILLQRRVGHFLFHFKSARRLVRLFRNGFVNVSCHKLICSLNL